jgi:hypothetical protein
MARSRAGRADLSRAGLRDHTSFAYPIGMLARFALLVGVPDSLRRGALLAVVAHADPGRHRLQRADRRRGSDRDDRRSALAFLAQRVHGALLVALSETTASLAGDVVS